MLVFHDPFVDSAVDPANILNERLHLSVIMMEGVSKLLKSEHEDVEKFRYFPIRRIQPALKRFLAIFQLNLDRLQQHKRNIEKFSSGSAELHREQVYSLRSVEQLIVTLKQLKQTRLQVELNDLPVFDLQLMEILNDSVLLSVQFLVLLRENKRESVIPKLIPTESPSNAGIRTLDDITYCSICTETYIDPRGLPCMHTFCLKCLQQYAKGKTPGCPIMCPLCRKEFAIPSGGVEATPKNFMMEQLLTLNQDSRQMSEEEKLKPTEEADNKISSDDDKTVKDLEMKLREFNDLIQELFSLIETRDSELRPVDATCVSAEKRESTINLSSFKLLLLPVAGAVIGGAIAGPVGIAAGLKAGKVAAVGGSLLGFTGGSLLRRKQSANQSMSLDETTDNSTELYLMRSTSNPAI